MRFKVELADVGVGVLPRRYYSTERGILLELIFVGSIIECGGKVVGIYEQGCDNNLRESCEFACGVSEHVEPFYMKFDKRIEFVDSTVPSGVLESRLMRRC